MHDICLEKKPCYLHLRSSSTWHLCPQSAGAHLGSTFCRRICCIACSQTAHGGLVWFLKSYGQAEQLPPPAHLEARKDIQGLLIQVGHTLMRSILWSQCKQGETTSIRQRQSHMPSVTRSSGLVPQMAPHLLDTPPRELVLVAVQTGKSGHARSAE
jgi:hypothetical protein